MLAAAWETIAFLTTDDPDAVRRGAAIRRAPGMRKFEFTSRDLAQATEFLRRSADDHRKLGERRRDSLRAMKVMIAQYVEWLPSLMGIGDRPGTGMRAYAEEILEAPDLPVLAVAVGQAIEVTHSLYDQLVAYGDVAGNQERARWFEEELNRLGRELNATSVALATDHLTGLLNRRGLEQSFSELAVGDDGADCLLSLALIDVDDFKRLNDDLGHQAGDDALRHLARIMRTNVRPVDAVARYGGEEFVILMPNVAAAEAACAIERVQRALRTELFRHRSGEMVIRFSAGVTQVRPNDGLTGTVALADEAMYRAKRSGKDHVVIAAQPC